MSEQLLMIGKTLGHYRIGEQLGRGGMKFIATTTSSWGSPSH
jgi:hypothetical protein